MDMVFLTTGSALFGVIVGGIFYGLKLLAKKVESDYLRGVLERGLEAVQRAVLEVEQTFVTNAKDTNGDGKLSAKEAQQAKAMALSKAKSYLGTKGLKELGKVAGVDGFFESAIEATIAKKKS